MSLILSLTKRYHDLPFVDEMGEDDEEEEHKLNSTSFPQYNNLQVNYNETKQSVITTAIATTTTTDIQQRQREIESDMYASK